jgi:hypothetical protein
MDLAAAVVAAGMVGAAGLCFVVALARRAMGAI